MSPAPSRESDALAALERLYQRQLVTLEQAQSAARIISGDPQAVFPPPARKSAPTATDAAAAEGSPLETP